MESVLFKKMSGTAILPSYQTKGSAAMDIVADLGGEGQTLLIAPGSRALVSSGFGVAIPYCFEGQIRPRSGLASKQGLTVINSPGTLDADFRGLVRVALVNLGQDAVTVMHGDRIAQLVIAPIIRARCEEVEELPPTSRGAGGFGSTGR